MAWDFSEFLSLLSSMAMENGWVCRSCPRPGEEMKTGSASQSALFGPSTRELSGDLTIRKLAQLGEAVGHKECQVGFDNKV